MKKRFVPVILFLVSFFVFSCEEVYRDEIFNDQYKIIYGEWRHIETNSGWDRGFINREDYTIKFTPIGKFSYKNGKTGIITIREQNENRLLIDFNNLFPDASIEVIGFQGNDTMSIGTIGPNTLFRLFVRKSK